MSEEKVDLAEVEERVEEVQVQIATEERPPAKNSCGWMNGVMFIIGVVIGSGIFMSPSVMAKHSSIGSYFGAWLMGFILCSIGALSEYSVPVREIYLWLHHKHGRYIGLLSIWVQVVLVVPVGNMVIALVISRHIVHAMIVMQNVEFPEAFNEPTALRFVAGIIVVVVSFWEWLSTKRYVCGVSACLKTMLMVIQMFSVLVVIIAGFVYLGTSKAKLFEKWTHEEETFNFGNFAMSLYAVLYAFSGWQGIPSNTFSSDIPRRKLLPYVLLAVGMVFVTYMLMNVVFIGAVPKNHLNQTSHSLGVEFAHVFGPLSWLMPILVIFFCLGSLQGCIDIGLRMIKMSSQFGLPFELSPWKYLVFSCIVSLLVLSSVEIPNLVIFFVFNDMVLSIIINVCIIKARLEHDIINGKHARVFTALHFLYLCCLCTMIAFGLFYAPLQIGLGIVFVIVGALLCGCLKCCIDKSGQTDCTNDENSDETDLLSQQSVDETEPDYTCQEKTDAFQSMLIRLSKMIGQETMKALKHLVVAQKGRREKVEDGHELWQYMREIGVLGEDDLMKLKNILNTCDRIDMLDVVRRYEEKYCGAAC